MIQSNSKLLNKQQLITGAKDFIFQSPASRYLNSKHVEIKFLWQQLSALRITLIIHGAWKPTMCDTNTTFITDAFIDKGYSPTILAVLNGISVYMKVVVLSNIYYDMLII